MTGIKSELRARAEAALRERDELTSTALSSLSPEAVHRQLHELQVHQLELEMQNDELRRNQSALEAAHARYVNLYDQAPMGYCATTSQGIVREANATLESLLGVPRSAIVGHPFGRFVTRQDADGYELMRRELVRSGQRQSCELGMVTVDAKPFWAHISATLGEDEAGQQLIGLAVSDIGERKATEASLHTSRALIVSVLDSLMDQVAVLDGDGIIINANRAWQDFAARMTTAATPCATLGMSYLSMCDQGQACPPGDAGRSTAAGIRAVLAHESSAFDFVYACKLGFEPRWFHTRVVPLTGATVGAVVIHEDITARTVAEQQRQETERRYRTLIEWSPEAIFIHRDGRVIYANPAAAALYGVTSAEDMIGVAVLELVPEERREKLRQRLQDIAPDGRDSPRMEQKFVRRDGRILDVEAQAAIFEFDGAPAIHASVHDITAHKMTEALLREQTRELRTRNEALSRFNQAAVGRELRMIELKQEINTLSAALGHAAPYRIAGES